jgi:hypothetical protein
MYYLLPDDQFQQRHYYVERKEFEADDTNVS